MYIMYSLQCASCMHVLCVSILQHDHFHCLCKLAQCGAYLTMCTLTPRTMVSSSSAHACMPTTSPSPVERLAIHFRQRQHEQQHHHAPVDRARRRIQHPVHCDGALGLGARRIVGQRLPLALVVTPGRWCGLHVLGRGWWVLCGG